MEAFLISSTDGHFQSLKKLKSFWEKIIVVGLLDGFNCTIKLKTELGLECAPIFMMTASDDRESVYRSINAKLQFS